MNERALLTALQSARYPRQSWAFLRHVNEGTGARAGRILDALAMSLWPSRGLHLHGIEVKCHRSDWLRELAAPSKADGWFQSVHAFYLATPPGVAKVDELPPAWGLLEVSDKVKTVKEATPQTPPLLSWQRLASLLRAATLAGDLVVPKEEVETRVRESAEKLAESFLASEREAHKRATEREEKLRAAINRFSSLAGIDISTCSEEHAQLAGKSVRGDRALQRIQGELQHAETDLERLLASIKQARSRLAEKGEAK